MRLWLWLFLGPALTAGAAPKKSNTTECIGPTQAKGHVIYLHGLAPPKQKKNEEGENLEVLEKIARDFSLRIAIPRGSVCPNGKLCWPARDRATVLQTFKGLKERAQSCWSGKPKYSLIGFSNGGYFAFKLWKAHQDPQLTRIIAAGAAGLWDEKTDKPNPHSTLAMMMGNQDITLKETTRLVETLRKKVPGLQFEKFNGGHRLDYGAIAAILKRKKT